MIVPFGISFAFNADSPPLVNARVLSVLLENLIALDRVYIRCMKEVGHAVPELHRSGVVYGRTQVWDTIPDVMLRRYGDCKSLSAWYIAELREKGQQAKAVFRWIVNPTNGQRDFHILVQTAKGWSDPSKDLGMNSSNQFIEQT